MIMMIKVYAYVHAVGYMSRGIRSSDAGSVSKILGLKLILTYVTVIKKGSARKPV